MFMLLSGEGGTRLIGSGFGTTCLQLINKINMQQNLDVDLFCTVSILYLGYRKPTCL
jgi:hypothetical protein